MTEFGIENFSHPSWYMVTVPRYISSDDYMEMEVERRVLIGWLKDNELIAYPTPDIIGNGDLAWSANFKTYNAALEFYLRFG